jgi:hypothetical protein
MQHMPVTTADWAADFATGQQTPIMAPSRSSSFHSMPAQNVGPDMMYGDSRGAFMHSPSTQGILSCLMTPNRSYFILYQGSMPWNHSLSTQPMINQHAPGVLTHQLHQMTTTIPSGFDLVFTNLFF